MSKNSLFKALLINKESVAEEVAKYAAGFLRIDDTTCSPVLPLSVTGLSAQDRILLELTARYFCFLAENVSTDTLPRSDLGGRCKLVDSALRARLSDLRKSNFVESSDEGERITATGLIEVKELLYRLKEQHRTGTGSTESGKGVDSH